MPLEVAKAIFLKQVRCGPRLAPERMLVHIGGDNNYMIGVHEQYIPKFAVALICFASAAIAAPTVTFTVQSPTGASFGPAGVLVSPYSAQISPSATPVPAICDDWVDNVGLPQTWTAFDTNLGSGDLTNVYYQGGYTYDSNNANANFNLTQEQAYQVAAILAEGLLSLPGAPGAPGAPWSALDPNAQDAYSFAIWELFNNAPGDLGATPSNYINGVSLALGQQAAGYIQTAFTQIGSTDFSNVHIYSAECSGAVCTGSTRPQEFIVVNMAEGPAPALLGAYLLGLGCLALVFRRRVVRQ